MAQWDAQLPAVQRERREAWQAWRALPEAERRQLRAAAKAYSALPPDRQQELRPKYDALDGSERRGWMLGPALGADYPKMHSLVSQVPTEPREALLAALRQLTPEGRDELEGLGHRPPPQETVKTE